MSSPLPLLLTLLLLSIPTISSTTTCNKSTTLIGSQFPLTSIQHRLRGRIEILDACSFALHSFDMLPGSPNVTLVASSNVDLTNLTHSIPISSLPLHRTYSNASLTFRLPENLSFDNIPLISVWDPSTFSDFGHVWLTNQTDLSQSEAYFDNCLSLSDRYRVRWTLNNINNFVSIGLEAAVGSEYYMSFGWAKPKPEVSDNYMNGGDVTVAGFSEDGMPFAEDFLISKYNECVTGKDGNVEGVCPDGLFGGVNNTRLVYGHRRDGVAFVRYERPLVSGDEKYDVSVNKTANMTVIWALGLMRSPDGFGRYYLPRNYGDSVNASFGYLSLNLSEKVDNCVGPLDADDKEDQDLVIADGKTPLVVSSGPPVHYPNPPSPAKVIYINKKEAPLLRVERGVPVTFSIQAGHDVAFYVTSDPIGGNATVRNMTEVVYAGGPQFEGVPASPTELKWLPDRNTPDQVYYQSVFEPKMGWKVQVVDGGLSDMYNNSVVLDDQQVSLFWTLSDDSVSFAARGVKKSGFLAIGFGDGMKNSFSYVGWIDEKGKGHVNTYWIDGKDAMSIHPTFEELTYVRCSSENGIITFEFTRPLSPSCGGRKECNNKIDPTTPLKVIWAMGAQWAEEKLTARNMHSVTSNRPVRVHLLRGSAEAEQDLRPVLAVHGFMMFVAWGILFPGGILAARYLKHIKGDGWYRIHVYLQYSGISIVLLGVLFAAAELQGFYVSSVHVGFGVAAIVLACVQLINAFLRPKKLSNGETASLKRIIWEYFHVIVGRSSIIVGIATLFSGMKHLGQRYGSENIEGLTLALILWVLAGTVLVLYLEYMDVKRRRNDKHSMRGSWVLGNSEEEDSVDLLHRSRPASKSKSHMSEVMEVQLEPVNL